MDVTTYPAWNGATVALLADVTNHPQNIAAPTSELLANPRMFNVCDGAKLFGFCRLFVSYLMPGSFMDKAKRDGKPFFVWMNPARAHVLTHLSPKYEAMRNPTTDFGLEEAAMKQLDDNVGVVLN